MPDADEIRSIDLGDDPVGPPPTEGQQDQIRDVIRAAAKPYVDAELANKADLVDGSVPLVQIPALPASKITEGILADDRIPSTVARTDDVYSKSATDSLLENKADLVGGTVPDTQIADNVARLDAPSTQVFVNDVQIGDDSLFDANSSLKIVSDYGGHKKTIELTGRTVKITEGETGDGIVLDAGNDNESEPRQIRANGVVYVLTEPGGALLTTNSAIPEGQIPNLPASKINSGTFTDARIPNLSTSKITSGTFAAARIPTLDAGHITTGVFAVLRIPDLDASKVTTGTFSDARIPTTIARATDVYTKTESNANTDALRAEINRTKQPVGGVHFGFGDPSATLPLTTADLDNGVGFAISCIFQQTERGAASGNRCVVGSLRGASTYHTGGVGLALSTSALRFDNEKGATNTSGPLITLNVNEIYHAIAKYDAVTGQATLKLSDGRIATATWDNPLFTSIRNWTLFKAATNNATGDDLTRSAAGTAHHLAIFSRPTTDEEDAQLFASGGRIMPLSARADCIVDLAMDDGGYQLRDRSGNGRHALLSPTGCTHLLRKEQGKLSQKNINATTAVYMLGDRDILPANAIITAIWINNEPINMLSAAVQNQALRRIRLRESPDLEDALRLERSNGTTHEEIIDSAFGLTGNNVTLFYEIFDA